MGELGAPLGVLVIDAVWVLEHDGDSTRVQSNEIDIAAPVKFPFRLTHTRLPSAHCPATFNWAEIRNVCVSFSLV